MASKNINASNAIIKVDEFLKSNEAKECFPKWQKCFLTGSGFNRPKTMAEIMGKIVDDVDPIQKQKDWF